MLCCPFLLYLATGEFEQRAIGNRFVTFGRRASPFVCPWQDGAVRLKEKDEKVNRAASLSR
jgi:hypothetical protein